MFAVEPSLNCPHFSSRDNLLPAEHWSGFVLGHTSSSTESGEQPAGEHPTVEFAEVACRDCGDSSENWLCLGCGGVFCSRFVHGHMQAHVVSCSGEGLRPVASASSSSTVDPSSTSSARHCLALSLSDLSCWCAACDCYVKSALMYPAQDMLYFAKFRELPPDRFSRDSSASASEDVASLDLLLRSLENLPCVAHAELVLSSGGRGLLPTECSICQARGPSYVDSAFSLYL